ncbi:Zinc carboxypeptidase A 1, partial [Geodia barretti]
ASGSNYTSERSADLYLASGVASDWFYGEEATSENEGYRAASYTVELRPSGTASYGFELPSDQIIPTAEEVVPAIISFAEAILADPIVNN